MACADGEFDGFGAVAVSEAPLESRASMQNEFFGGGLVVVVVVIAVAVMLAVMFGFAFGEFVAFVVAGIGIGGVPTA